MSNSLLKKKAFCVVTGASRGYGRCIAEKFATQVCAGSTFLLLARQTQQLQEVSDSLKSLNPDIKVICHGFDQTKVQECSVDFLENILSANDVSPSSFDQLLLFHNAGMTGDLTKFAHQLHDGAMVEQTMNCNITGMIVLNASLLSIFPGSVVGSRVIINVSSLAAIQAFPSWSLYCAAKAARDMFMMALVKEDSSLRVLNYAPGPLDTEMQKNCRECADEEIRKLFTDMHAKGKLLKCEESVDKLIQLLETNTFESGAHIDYYDV